MAESSEPRPDHPAGDLLSDVQALGMFASVIVSTHLACVTIAINKPFVTLRFRARPLRARHVPRLPPADLLVEDRLEHLARRVGAPVRIGEN